MITLLLLITLGIISYFIIRKLAQQRTIIRQLREELKRQSSSGRR